MKTLTIEIPEPGDEHACGFDVVDGEGRRCNGLGWDEMLGQVAMLTIPPGRVGNGYRMQTREQWEAERRRVTASTQASNELGWME